MYDDLNNDELVDEWTTAVVRTEVINTVRDHMYEFFPGVLSDDAEGLLRDEAIRVACEQHKLRTMLRLRNVNVTSRDIQPKREELGVPWRSRV